MHLENGKYYIWKHAAWIWSRSVPRLCIFLFFSDAGGTRQGRAAQHRCGDLLPTGAGECSGSFSTCFFVLESCNWLKKATGWCETKQDWPALAEVLQAEVATFSQQKWCEIKKVATFLIEKSNKLWFFKWRTGMCPAAQWKIRCNAFASGRGSGSPTTWRWQEGAGRAETESFRDEFDVETHCRKSLKAIQMFETKQLKHIIIIFFFFFKPSVLVWSFHFSVIFVHSRRKKHKLFGQMDELKKCQYEPITELCWVIQLIKLYLRS